MYCKYQNPIWRPAAILDSQIAHTFHCIAARVVQFIVVPSVFDSLQFRRYMIDTNYFANKRVRSSKTIIQLYYIITAMREQ